MPEVDAIPKASTIFWSMVTYDPATDPFGQVPGDHTMGTPEYFTIPVFDAPPYTDTVTINTTNSTYVPATPSLTIEATCSGTCTEVYCVFGGQEFLMGTGAGTHTKTLTSADGVQNIQPKGNPGFTVDTIVGRVYVISVDSSGNTTDQAAIDFKENSVKTAISYP